MTRWGRRAARIYLAVGGLALLAMLVETITGRGGAGTMFAAILAVPWSMLVANFLPPLPRDWPLMAALGARLVLLAFFMLLNAAIVAGIAARSERDIARTAGRAGVLLLALAAMLSSGCILTSRQVVLVASPTAVTLMFSGGTGITVFSFDLRSNPDWNEHHGHISSVTDLAVMGDFANPTGPFLGEPPVDVVIGVAPVKSPAFGSGTDVWGPLHLEPNASRRLSWDQGSGLFRSDRRALSAEIAGDGQFALVVRSVSPPFGVGLASVENLRLGAVLQVK